MTTHSGASERDTEENREQDLSRTHDMSVIFLGGLFPQDSQHWIQQLSKGNVQNAANVMQWNFLHGLASHLGTQLRVISAPFIGSFPKFFRRLILRDFQFPVDGTGAARGIGFLNAPLLKHFSRYFRLRKPLEEAITATNGPTALVAYTFSSVMVFALKRAKRVNPDLVTCLVVADLPEYMNLSATKPTLRSRLGNLSIKRMYEALEYVDCAVVLTEPMITKMEFTKPHVVIEGITDRSEPSSSRPAELSQDDSERFILYTGGLNEAFGVVNLVKAFSTIADDSLRLVLCGAGAAVPIIQAYAQSDHRIIYKGLLPRDEVVSLQRQATVLINPRQNIGEYVKYSFPSKIMEYMASETPVIAYHLDGMPQEYLEHLFVVPRNDIEALAQTIQQVLEKSPTERRAFGQRAREFVQQHKNPEHQTAKLLRMISDISTGQREHHGQL